MVLQNGLTSGIPKVNLLVCGDIRLPVVIELYNLQTATQ